MVTAVTVVPAALLFVLRTDACVEITDMTDEETSEMNSIVLRLKLLSGLILFCFLVAFM